MEKSAAHTARVWTVGPWGAQARGAHGPIPDFPTAPTFFFNFWGEFRGALREIYGLIGKTEHCRSSYYVDREAIVGKP